MQDSLNSKTAAIFLGGGFAIWNLHRLNCLPCFLNSYKLFAIFDAKYTFSRNAAILLCKETP